MTTTSTRNEFSNMFALAGEERRSKDKEKDAAGITITDESHILVVGSKSGGKTSIVLNFLERNETPNTTNALEYTYARKSRGANLAKDVCHIWELGGGVSLSQLVEVPITQENISRLSVAVIVDLSNPGLIWDTAETLINKIRSRITEVLTELKTTSPKLVRSLKSRANGRYGNDHPDKELVNPLLVPAAIIGTRYDQFQGMDPEVKKVVCKSLRFLAHTCGASLIFCSINSDSQLSKVQQQLSNFAFNVPLNQPVSMDHNKPVIVPVGSDALGQIGAPTMASGGNLDQLSAKNPADLWRMAFNGYFAKQVVTKGNHSMDSGGVAPDPCKDKKYSEVAIDSLRAQKDEDLQRYIRECERKKKQREVRLTKTTPIN